MATTKNDNRVIQVTLNFFVDGLAPNNDIVPKNAWTQGTAYLVANKAHGITAGSQKHFNSLLGMTSAIEGVLLSQGITLHPSAKDKKLLRSKA